MNKIVCIALLGLVAAHMVAASTLAERLRMKIAQSGSESLTSSMSVPVSTSLSGSLGSVSESLGSASLSGSVSLSGSGSSGGVPATSLVSGSSCEQGCGSTNIQNGPMNIEDALSPIDDWLKDFKKRTMGAEGAGDLYAAAKATVKPLIDKLKKNQQSAVQRLVESNNQILTHVEDAAVQHVYALLKVDRDKMDAQEQKQELADKVLAMKEEERLRKERDAAIMGIASTAVGALNKAVGGSSGSSSSGSK
jgi:hypothetical protein